MRKLGAFVAAGLLAVAALAVPVINAVWHESGAQSGPVAVAADDRGKVTQSDERGGPPPWAHSVAKGKHGKPGLGSWKRLTPDQREDLMTRLAREHRAGMKAYRACRSDGRADCQKPLPPGLAKRQ